jgi:hypothetical protein
MEKICVFCREWYIQQATPDYSEYTPGESAEIGCRLGRWYVNLACYSSKLAGGTHPPEKGPINDEYYRKCLLSAKACPEFDPVEEFIE